jgi:site-specific recombinase XerD
MKRAMGFKYRVQNSLLQLFATFAEARGDIVVRSHTVLEWAELAPSPAQRRNRLLTVRRFAIAMQSASNSYEIPPANAFGPQPGKRRIPHIFSSEEVGQLLYAASQLKPQETIRSKTYTTLFALLATTGLRVSEALALNLEDINADGLIIKCTKFRKDRLVPLHTSTQQGIECYLNARKRHDTNNESALFISNKGLRIPYSTVVATYLQLMRSVGLRGVPDSPGACK